jgi:hypothetical protein
VARLNVLLEAGERVLSPPDLRTGYLRPVLEALGVPAASQVLVFSKTGTQRSHTGPMTPRALYFDESVVVGYVPGAPVLEIAAHDPQQGVRFYTLDQAAAGTPRFTNGNGCLTCHVSSGTLGVPGMIARSHLVDSAGRVVPGEPVVDVTHETLHTARWSGWFVTSNSTAPPYAQGAHQGNVAATLLPATGPSIVSNHVFVEWMNSAPESRGYLAPASDLAALLTFDHQVRAINLLTRLNWEARVAAEEDRDVASAVAVRAREVADYLLFAREAPLAAEIEPLPAFSGYLAARTPADRRGRSLGELELTTRLLRYPCSYVVYAPAFDALPTAAKHAVYRRMFAVLSGKAQGPGYAHLTPAVRRAIREILRETKRDLPAEFR